MKLNKKGFTLVELLAVIVVLALLMVVVANSALPALNNAKKSSLETFAQRVEEKAKEKCMSDKLLNDKADCKYKTVADVMGKENKEYQFKGDGIIVTIDNNDNYTVSGEIYDSKNENLGTYNYSNGKLMTTAKAGS